MIQIAPKWLKFIIQGIKIQSYYSVDRWSIDLRLCINLALYIFYLAWYIHFIHYSWYYHSLKNFCCVTQSSSRNSHYKVPVKYKLKFQYISFDNKFNCILLEKSKGTQIHCLCFIYSNNDEIQRRKH